MLKNTWSAVGGEAHLYNCTGDPTAHLHPRPRKQPVSYLADRQYEVSCIGRTELSSNRSHACDGDVWSLLHGQTCTDCLLARLPAGISKQYPGFAKDSKYSVPQPWSTQDSASADIIESRARQQSDGAQIGSPRIACTAHYKPCAPDTSMAVRLSHTTASHARERLLETAFARHPANADQKGQERCHRCERCTATTLSPAVPSAVAVTC